MASSLKVLLVLFDGLPGTVIESQVLVHAREMTRLGIASFEIWVVASSGPLYRRSRAARPRAQALAGCPVRVLRGIRPAMPFSVMLNALILGAAVLRHRPRVDLLHARTDYAAAVCSFLKPWRRFILVWDCRGDSVAEFAERFQPRSTLLRMARNIRLRLLARDRRRAARTCDRAILVSRVLERLVGPAIDGKFRAIIPCAASDELFNLDEDQRAEMRRDLGYGPEHRVYIFSGSLAAYQCFEETLALFAEIRARDAQARLLVVTPRQEEARRIIAAHAGTDTLLRSATITDMNRYLNGADVAFMLREPTATNRAAFPTKFAEYCLAGLPVVMTAAVPDACAMAERLGNLVAPPVAGVIDLPKDYDRRRVACAARACLSRTALAPRYAEIYDPLSRPRPGAIRAGRSSPREAE